MLLRPAFQIDITWKKMLSLAILSIFPRRRKHHNSSEYSDTSYLLFCDSVRAGFVTLLTAQDWPRGSEIIFTYPTIPMMPALAQKLGYRVVAADCEVDHHPASVASIQRLITDSTQAVVLAPLLGCRLDLQAYRKVCDSRNIMLIEDAAQGYQEGGFATRSGAHCTMLSFGLLKKASCLRGGLLLFEAQNLRDRCGAVQSKFKESRLSAFYKRWTLAFLAKICTGSPLAYGCFDWLARRFNTRLSTVLLAMARPRNACLDPEMYKVRPHRVTIDAIQQTLLQAAGTGQRFECCRQRALVSSKSQVGLWPSVAVMRDEDVACCLQKGFDVVPAAVRLDAPKHIKGGDLRHPNAARFLKRAFFVHQSYFED